MIRKVQVSGEILEGGILKLDNKNEFRRLLAYLKPGRYCVTVEPPKRSNEHLRYYMGWCGTVAERLAQRGCEGWNAEDVHEWNKRECNPIIKLMLTKDGDVFEERWPGETKHMNDSQFSTFCELAKQKWAEVGINVKDEYWKEQ